MITISESAAHQIVKLIAKEEQKQLAGLRVGVKAGGCSGFEYTFAWESTPKETDQVFEGAEGAKVFVDPRSLKLLDGTTLRLRLPRSSQVAPGELSALPRQRLSAFPLATS